MTNPHRPYWLEEGDESCEICGVTMAVQVELRCTGCDAGICEQCSVTVHETREVVCVPCSRREDHG
jgi:hypothetical protein